jgi:hypothetical protein
MPHRAGERRRFVLDSTAGGRGRDRTFRARGRAWCADRRRRGFSAADPAPDGHIRLGNQSITTDAIGPGIRARASVIAQIDNGG